MSQPRHVVDTVRMAAEVRIFVATEPTARVDSWRLAEEKKVRRLKRPPQR